MGYDNVDLAACTEKDIAVYITSKGVVKPMAESIVLFVLRLRRLGGEGESLEACGEVGEARPWAAEALRVRRELMPATEADLGAIARKISSGGSETIAPRIGVKQKNEDLFGRCCASDRATPLL